MTDVPAMSTASARGAGPGAAGLLRGARPPARPGASGRGSRGGRGGRAGLGGRAGRGGQGGRAARSGTATADGRRWSTETLAGLVALLAALFVVAPATLAGGTYGRGPSATGELAAVTRASVVDLWSSPTGDLPPALRAGVDYWARYHVAKALIAVLLTVALVALGRRLWRSLVAAGPAAGGRTRAAVLVVAALALVAGVLAMANVQGAVAPLFSLLALAEPEAGGGDLGHVASQARELLATPAATRSDAHGHALDALVDSFARYHAVLAVLATGAALGLAVLGVRALRARRSPAVAAPTRRTLRTLGLAALAVACLLGVVALANASNAGAPERGLAVFFGGA